MSILAEINRIDGNIAASLDAVAAKGVNVPDGANSNDLPSLIEAIPKGAELPDLTTPGSADDLLEGKQFIDGDGNIVEGAMPVRTAEDITAKVVDVESDFLPVSIKGGYYGESTGKDIDLTALVDYRYDKGYDEGHTEGYNKGYPEGYNLGYDDGHRDGYDDGFAAGVESGGGDEPEKESVGLQYSIIDDETCTVTGIGTCTDTDVVIPKTHEGLPVTAIFASAFSRNQTIRSVVIPDSVHTIEGFAFEYTNIEEIYIPSSVTVVEQGAFNMCPNLTIYCEAKSKPDGWSEWWCDGQTVIWGYNSDNGTDPLLEEMLIATDENYDDEGKQFYSVYKWLGAYHTNFSSVPFTLNIMNNHPTLYMHVYITVYGAFYSEEEDTYNDEHFANYTLTIGPDQEENSIEVDAYVYDYYIEGVRWSEDGV